MAFLANGGTVSLPSASAQSVGGDFPLVFNNLTVSNAAGVALTADVTVNAVMTLSNGRVTTNGNVLYMSSTGSVTRTSGHVVGALTKYVPAGNPSVTFEIGDAALYAPATLVFNGVAGGGDVAASTTPTEHPQLAASTIDGNLSVNRHWTLAGPAISYVDYAATFSFNAADLDVGVNTANFIAARYSAGTWASQATIAAAATHTTVSGVSGFGDFAVGTPLGGAVDHFVVAAPPTATAGTAVNLTITAVDAAGNRIAAYTGTVDLSSSDAFAAFSPSSYTFTSADAGQRTLSAAATFKAAAAQTVSATEGARTGTSATVTITAAAFSKLQILVPGETSVPGSATGRTGAPTAQQANTPFNVTVSAVDAYWNAVSSADAVAITSSDPLAVLPPDAALVAGSGTFAVTLQSSGSATLTATDVTDGAKTADTSTPVPITNTAPVAGDDSYEMTADQTLIVAVAGVLVNDSDPELQAISVGLPRPISGPAHGSLTLNADGSFEYTPTGGYTGTESFEYQASDGSLSSGTATVTIVVRDHALISTSGWGTSFDAARYLELDYPRYVPVGAMVGGATVHFGYRSLDGAGTTCYYVEVYADGLLAGTHGSPGSPVSCNSAGAYVTDDISLPEIDTVAEANDVSVRVFMANSAGARAQIERATLGVDWYLP